MAGKEAISDLAFLETLSKDPQVTEYLSYDELADLTSMDYYLKYIDTAFARLGLE